jgi:capsular exopolysaccharide synthesis family protein
MSRVDEALQAFEKNKGFGIKSSPQPHESQRFTLSGYAREEAASRKESEPRVAEAFKAPQQFPVSPAGSPKAIRESRVRLEPSQREHAPLVTTSANPVMIEQYRRLAAVLHDLQVQQGLKTVMVTSALPAEGKTLTTLNLALTLSASFERRVLLIEADLRRPTLHKMVAIPNVPGLGEYLREEVSDVPCRQVLPNLAVLPGGKGSQALLGGLTSSRMTALLKECASRFDWVLLDTPPVGVLPDAQPLARLTGAVVFVIAAGVTPSRAIERAVAELGSECIIGTVLNRVDERRIPAAGYYYYSDATDEESPGPQE